MWFVVAFRPQPVFGSINTHFLTLSPPMVLTCGFSFFWPLVFWSVVLPIFAG